jgi:hypothetical protein
MRELLTTEDCMLEARELLEKAHKVSTREEHIRVWDRKTEVLKVVNNAFESGAFDGEAYGELWEAKHTLNLIERVAGNQAMKTYAKQ